MNTWTDSALQTLESYLRRNRLQVAATGADPDEVVADLRRHIEEEVAALQLPVVTEKDVRRIMHQIGPLPEEPVQTAECSSTDAPSPKPKNAANSIWLMVFGVVLPAFTIGFELFTRLCAGVFFDPLPTFFHVVLAAFVPLANWLTLRNLRNHHRPVSRELWFANGIACGVSLLYAALLLPMSPFAMVGIIFAGAGLLPLAPLLAFVSALQLRVLLKRQQLLRDETIFRGWGWSMTAPILALMLFSLPGPLTRHWINQAGSESPEISNRAVQLLRTWGSKTTILKEAYGRGNRLWVELYSSRPNPELARKVYYRVTGQPFNSAPPPLSKYQAAGRTLFDEFNWDPALGGDNVAGQLKGLSLVQSRFDGMCRADEGWAYVEWLLEFQNDHASNQQEARAQVLLPPGGVVSRLTLWVNGEEREAAFAGRAHVREAYQKVAVVQRRDPVLVTTSGRDRVLVQCFPVPAGGGTMKVRLGITAPLFIESADQAALRLPSFIERNFGVPSSLQHSFWLESPQELSLRMQKPVVNTSKAEKFGWRGQFSDAELGSPESTIRFKYSPKLFSVFAKDKKSTDGQVIHQTLERGEVKLPSRIAVVLDGSADMTAFFPQIAQALDGLPGKPLLGVWFAQEGVQQLFCSEWKSSESISAVVGKLRGMGGQDDLPALLQAWEWAAATPDSVVLWIHGTQPVLLSGMEMLKQRLEWCGKEGPQIIDVPARAGPNRIAEQLSNHDVLVALSRLGELKNDLERLFAIWSGRRPEFKFARALAPNVTTASVREPMVTSASSHVVRLWAFDQIHALAKARKIAQAVQLAGQYQLVTPISGAVVLETTDQFKDAGLTSANPATVPVVPEPSTWVLVIFAGVVLLLYRKIAPLWKTFVKRTNAKRKG